MAFRKQIYFQEHETFYDVAHSTKIASVFILFAVRRSCGGGGGSGDGESS